MAGSSDGTGSGEMSGGATDLAGGHRSLVGCDLHGDVDPFRPLDQKIDKVLDFPVLIRGEPVQFIFQRFHDG